MVEILGGRWGEDKVYLRYIGHIGVRKAGNDKVSILEIQYTLRSDIVTKCVLMTSKFVSGMYTTFA